jgi:hypothetical protein
VNHSTIWKVFRKNGIFVASTKEPEAAAALASFYGDGTFIRFDHSGPIVWVEGRERIPAGESYDDAAILMDSRQTYHSDLLAEIRRIDQELMNLSTFGTPDDASRRAELLKAKKAAKALERAAKNGGR